jgi:hypothetical protein
MVPRQNCSELLLLIELRSGFDGLGGSLAPPCCLALLEGRSFQTKLGKFCSSIFSFCGTTTISLEIQNNAFNESVKYLFKHFQRKGLFRNDGKRRDANASRREFSLTTEARRAQRRNLSVRLER